MNISQKVKKYMAQNKLTQTMLSKESGVSQATICRILNEHPSQRHGNARTRLIKHLEDKGISFEKEPQLEDLYQATTELIEALKVFRSRLFNE